MARKKTKEKEPVKTIQMAPAATGDAFSSVNTTALAVKEEAPPIIMPEGNMTPEFSLALAKRRITQFKGIVKCIASEIRPDQLMIFAPFKAKTIEDLLPLKAYLPLHTCQSILSWAGAIWMPDKETIERRDRDELGEFIEYDQWVDVMTNDNREIRIFGTCSTRHAFHGVAFTFYACPACRAPLAFGKECPSHGKVKARKLNAYKPLSDVNRGNVRKHAMTNAFNKAVEALGLTPTLSELKEAGMDITKIPRANFGARDDDDSPPQQNHPPKPSSPPGNATASSSSPQQAPSSQADTAKAPSQQAEPKAQPSQRAEPKAPDPIIAGTLMRCQEAKKKSKINEKGEEAGLQPFLFLLVRTQDGSERKIATFDNKELAIDTRGNKQRAFSLLPEALNKRIAVRAKTVGEHANLSSYLQIGDLEWEQDGTPILRRDAYEPSDEDTGLGGFPEGIAGGE